MREQFIKLAATVVEKASRERPADAVLRNELKGHPGLTRESSRHISRTVFAYYRWFGWLETDQPVARQLQQAIELDQHFRQRPVDFAAAELRARAVPVWIAAHLEVSDEWLRALQSPPRLWLRARLGQGASLARTLRDAEVCGRGEMPDALEYQGSADLFRTQEFQAGEFEVQDLSSQAVGLLCDPRPAETWWDACAGEGGKTLHLSDLMRNQGLIWATDRVAWRLQKLKFRAARVQVYNYRTRLWRGPPQVPFQTKFEGILVDAPCTGIGTWHRNPHARWTCGPEDVRDLAEIQSGLLACVAAAVKPGGRLIYSVCSLTRAETTEIASAFESRFPEFRPRPLHHPLQSTQRPQAQQWFWPSEGGGNGMFVAAWERE